MKIYTKKGDAGETGLIGGTRVRKNALQIEAYGTVDELNSWLGVLRDRSVSETDQSELIFIQDRLFTMGSHLASDPLKSSMKLPTITVDDISRLEVCIDAMESGLEPMKNFILPGGHETVSFCHVARCVCRRAERLVVALNQNQVQSPVTLAYLNRLSDFLFVYSRHVAKRLKAKEIAWKPNS